MSSVCWKAGTYTSTWNSTTNSWQDWDPCLTSQGKEIHAGITLLFKDMLSAHFSPHLKSEKDKQFLAEKNPKQQTYVY